MLVYIKNLIYLLFLILNFLQKYHKAKIKKVELIVFV